MNVISNKFEFDTKNEKCWYYIGSEKKEVPQDLKMNGNYDYQKVFQLDKDHKDHWINFALTYSGGKVWLKTWYKRKIKDDYSNPPSFNFFHFQKKVEKTSDIMVIEFTNADEMLKIWDEQKQKYRFKSISE